MFYQINTRESVHNIQPKTSAKGRLKSLAISNQDKKAAKKPLFCLILRAGAFTGRKNLNFMGFIYWLKSKVLLGQNFKAAAHTAALKYYIYLNL